jgi:uncharacterized membrane protein YeaQ/YmgE (transglycosylase-associated protein family)
LFGSGRVVKVERRGIRSALMENHNFMGIIGWILFGLVVGAAGKLLMPGRDPGGFIVTILLGIAGALLGGHLGRMLGLYREDEPASLVMAALGSILLLAIYRLTFSRRSI